MNTYIYSGPVFRFGDYFDDVDSVVTQAPTINKGYTNILYKLKCYYGLARDAKLSIDKANIIQVKKEHDRFCKECGALLTDAGDCPVCDFGENPDDFI